MAQQTAVEWFYENTQDYVRLSDTVPMVIKIEIPFIKYMDVLKQAKQMEKEQIMDSFCSGSWYENQDIEKYAEEYFKETYK